MGTPDFAVGTLEEEEEEDDDGKSVGEMAKK